MASLPPGPQPKRDFESCKVIFGTALSQILYARRSFAPSMFQVIPLRDLGGAPRFENIITTGSRVDRWDRELMRDQDNVLFLRQDANNYELNHFLGILTTDIFSLLEREQLVKFRVSFLSSPTLSEESLVEYYTFAIKYTPGGNYAIDIWRAGTGKHHISTTDSKLWNLGDYLSRLSPLTDPIYCTLAFHARERPEEPAIGMWGFDRSHFENAKMRLQQREGHSFQRIADLLIGKLALSAYNQESDATRGGNQDETQEAEATTDATAEEALADDRPPNESDSEPEEISPQEEILGSMDSEEGDPEEADVEHKVVKEAPLHGRIHGSRISGEAPPPQPRAARPEEPQAEPSPPRRKATKAGAKKASNPKPRAGPKSKLEPEPKPNPKATPKPKPEPKRKAQPKPKPKAQPKPNEEPKPKPKAKASAPKSRGNTKGRGKNSPAKSPEVEADTSQPSGRKIATKRKPKTPLQLDPQPQLQIYEEVNSNMTETQPAARLNQLKSQNTQSGTHKRTRDDEETTNSRLKRLRSSPQQFSALSSIGNPRANSPAINGPSSHGFISPKETQSQGEDLDEPSPMPGLDDDSAPAGGLFGATLTSGGPSRPAKAMVRKPSLFDGQLSCSGDEDEDDDDDGVDDLGPQAMFGAPTSGLDSWHGTGTGIEEVPGQEAVGGQPLFPGIVESDDEEE